MFTGFTHQEQRVLLALVVIVTLGLGIHHYKNRPQLDVLSVSAESPPLTRKERPLTSKVEETKTKATEIPPSLININTASLEDLCTLKGIGPVKAQEIIKYRTTRKPFDTIEELMKVRGIGKATFEGIRDEITVGEATPKKDLKPKSAPTTSTQILVSPTSPPPKKKAEVSIQAAPGGKININSATQEQLMTLKGIGEVRAKQIIEYREKSGPFRSIDELRKVKGIGEKTFLDLRDKITVGK